MQQQQQAVSNNYVGATTAQSTKIQKKKISNASNGLVTKSNKSFDKNAIIQVNNSSKVGNMGIPQHHNTFYGNVGSVNQNHPQSRQQNNSLGSKGGTLQSQTSTSQQQQQQQQ